MMRSEPALTASGSDVRAAMFWGLAVAGVLIAGIFLGSRSLKDFDPALVPYAGAAVFSAFGIGYRYSMWLRRPPFISIRVRLKHRLRPPFLRTYSTVLFRVELSRRHDHCHAGFQLTPWDRYRGTLKLLV
jgi:hypothetical protein